MDQDQVTQLIAAVAYIAKQIYYRGLGGNPQPAWDELDGWMRDDLTELVFLVRSGVTPEMSHTNWLSLKLAIGWTYGPRLDSIKKQHPDLVPYDALPMRRRIEDTLFLNAVRALEKQFSAVLSLSRRVDFAPMALSQTG